MNIAKEFSRLSILVTSLLFSQAFAATVFSPVNQPLGSMGAVELSNTYLPFGNVKAHCGGHSIR